MNEKDRKIFSLLGKWEKEYLKADIKLGVILDVNNKDFQYYQGIKHTLIDVIDDLQELLK